jgi:hypothetical protein
MQSELLRKISTNLTTRSNTFAVYITVGFFDVRGTSADWAGRPPQLGGEVNPELRHRFFAIVDRTNLSMGDPARQIYDPNYQFDGTVVDARKQSDRPIYVPFEPVTNGNPQVGTNQNPLRNGIPAGTQQIFATVFGAVSNGSLTITDTVTQNGGQETFTITPGQTIFYLDVGNSMERMLVTAVAPAQQQPQYILTLTPLGGAPNYTPGKSQSNHFRGASLCTQIAGNPGPQNYPLDLWSAPPNGHYGNTVVAYRQILK